MTSIASISRMTVQAVREFKAQPYGKRRRRVRRGKTSFEELGTTELTNSHRRQILEDVFVPAAQKQWKKRFYKDSKGNKYALRCHPKAYGVRKCDAAAKVKEKAFVVYHLKINQFHTWQSLRGNKYRRFRKEFLRKFKKTLAGSSFKLLRTSLQKYSNSWDKRAEYVFNDVLRVAANLKRVTQPNKPSTPTLTRNDLIQIGKAVKGALSSSGNLRGYKSIRALAIAIKGKKLAWSKNSNHPANIKLLDHLNKTMTGSAKPGKRHPSKYTDSQMNQRIYGSWLLHRYVDHLTRKAPRLTSGHIKLVGAALEKTRRRYKRKIGHGSLIPLTCALRLQLNVKWRWHKLSSRVHRYLVSALDKSMPSQLKPKTRYPVSVGFKRAYARWLLIQYVRYTKLKAPPARTLSLSDKQRRLYLKHAVLPAVRKAGVSYVWKPVEARRYLIWNKYRNLKMLPPVLDIKLSRYTSKLLKRRQFKSIRQEIADSRKQYCPSGGAKITNAMYRDAVWNPLAVADAKSARQRAKPATVKTVPLTPQQKRLVLAAVLKAVNKHLLQLGKKRFRNATQARRYLRKNGYIWSRLGSSLDRKLTIELVPLLLGKSFGNLGNLGKLPKQLSKMRRRLPKTLYNSAVFDTNVGYIAVDMRKLPSTAVPTKPARPAVALKPLKLKPEEFVAARKKLLYAWQTTYQTQYLPRYRNADKLARHLARGKLKNNKKLSANAKSWLMFAFKKELNSKNSPVPNSIRPKVKSPTKQTEFAQRVYIAILKAAGGTSGTVATKPTPPARPRPANPQLALQQGLVAAVRKVYGESKSESYAKTVLKSQKWSTLKTLGIVGLIQKEFASLGYRRAAKNSYLAKRLVKKTLKNWTTSSGTTTHTPVTPARPTPPAPRPSDKQGARQRLLLAAVRQVYGASKSESYAKTILKTQKWSTLKQLGIAAYIMKGFAKLGYRRTSRNHYLAQRLVKKTLKNWSTSSGTTQPVPVRPVTPAPRPANNQLALQNALVTAVRKVYGASKSESYAKTILKTQKWSTLKQLGIASDIQRAFGRLGHARAARNSYYAQKLLKKTLKNWQ